MSKQPIIPLFTSRGDVDAYLVYPYVYNRQGEWIGWVTPERDIYSVHGLYVGWVSKDARVLRRLSDSFDHPRRAVPPAPLRLNAPPTNPLAPLMAELPFGIMDVLLDHPDLLPSVDFGEGREDLD
jgi:hypothetical protein